MTKQRLDELVSYDPHTGEFLWRVNRGGKAQSGATAGGTDSHGYRQITIDGVKHLAHRLAFLTMTGQMPVGEVDHKNRVRDDNRWVNLRPATRSHNSVNRTTFPRSGGVGATRVGQMFQARISFRLPDGRKKCIHLGMFSSAEEAERAYREASYARNGAFALKE